MTKIFYDTEFIEDGRTIDLISIGLVVENGDTFYAVNNDAPWGRVAEHPWLAANVLPSLPGCPCGRLDELGWHPDAADIAVMHKIMLAMRVRKFILSYPEPELWAWYAAYDHVALCQLWGPMAELPEGIPMFTCDLKQEAVRQGDPELPEQPAGEHNALADAQHNLVRARALGLIA